MGVGVWVRQVPELGDRDWGTRQAAPCPGVTPEAQCSRKDQTMKEEVLVKGPWPGLSRICGSPKLATEAAWARLPQPPGFPGDMPKPVCFQASRDLPCTGVPLLTGMLLHLQRTGVLDSPAADILDGHRVSLRDGNTGCELGGTQARHHRRQSTVSALLGQACLPVETVHGHVCFLINHLMRIKLSYYFRPFKQQIFHFQRSHAQGLPLLTQRWIRKKDKGP